MNILELAILKKMVGGGGGSGTDNYNELSNLPQINGETLAGNKTAENLGLQDEITSENKLDADLVDDEESTNKFVTAQDKETWNAKQNAIDSSNKLSSDLVDDTNHTNKFVTSTEKQTWNGKQNAIDSDHKLSSSLVSYTTAEAAALASGIDSSKVGQISTNQTNILSVKQKVGVNLLHTNEFIGGGSDTGIDFTTENGIISVKGTKTIADSYRNIARDDFKASSKYYVVATTTGSPRVSIRVFGYKNGSYTQLIDTAGTAAFSTGDYESFLTRVVVGGRVNDTVNASISAMIISKEDYDAGLTEFQQYGAPNYDLTRLEAEDRASLAEVVDSGAKNVVDSVIKSQIITTDGANVTINVNSDKSFSFNGTTGTSDIFVTITEQCVIPAGNYILSGIADNAEIDYDLYIATGSQYECITNASYPISEFNPTTTATHTVAFRLTKNKTYTNQIVKPMICTLADWNVSHKYVPYRPNWDLVSSVAPFYSVPINHNMIYRGQNLGATFTDAQHTALSSGNFTDLFLGDYWTKSVTIPAGTYTGGDGEEVTVAAQTVTLKAVIADFDTFYAGYASSYAGINTHHAGVIVTGFDNVVWNKTNSTAGGYVASLIHKWLVGSVLPQLESWFGSAKVLSHQKLLTNAITGDAASGWAWSSQKISLLSECQLYGMKVWGGSKATNGAYEPGEAFKKLDVFNHIDANLLFGNGNIWCRDIASAGGAADLSDNGGAVYRDASTTWIAPAALILLS